MSYVMVPESNVLHFSQFALPRKACFLCLILMRCADRGATPKDYRVLPPKIILVRHAESEGNVDNFAYTYVPDPQVPLARGLSLRPVPSPHPRQHM